MNKEKFSFRLGKFKEKESENLGNIFGEEKKLKGDKDNKRNARDLDPRGSDNFQSISMNFEYNKSIKFYNEHPELLEDFDRPNEVKGQEAEKGPEKKEEPKRAFLGKSKYLGIIKEYVELRNIEKQEIQEEKIQKEIQEEENTQVFITDSYKEVLEERKRLKESLTNRRLSEGEDPKISGPSNILEVRFSPVKNELEDEESDKKTTSDALNEDLNVSNTNSANISTAKDDCVVNSDKISKTSKNLKLIKIQQARQRYLLRKQAKNLSKHEIHPSK
ncbi:uncharacterized protein ELE39_000488 [Cryptosporidium sp. chipmunk genotype I]|uniref:uncharacterized protein n=1 Tax=Cryptosporidium sp. chipmunk genotype I TaxID=1280935 RepID=UPI00351A90BB|nr:hypothetical protein ELE39_000488 [Cryptosporidium sp. chipmunk genotype I]